MVSNVRKRHSFSNEVRESIGPVREQDDSRAIENAAGQAFSARLHISENCSGDWRKEIWLDQEYSTLRVRNRPLSVEVSPISEWRR
jgi:hypothetical protein